jgi:hypothetical protein
MSKLAAAPLIMALVLVDGCRGSDVVNPPEGPNTSYPCGVWGVECSNGACCPWAHICGVEGDPWRRCAVGYCCYDGDPLFSGAGPDAGFAPLKQREKR